MKIILNTLLAFLAIFCSMELWVIKIGSVTLFFYEIFIILFIVFGLIYFLEKKTVSIPKGPLRNVLLFYSAWFLLILFSYFLIDFSITASIDQYIKNFLGLSIYILFSILAIIYIFEQDQEFIRKLLKIYLASCLVAGLYSIAEVTTALYGFDLNKEVFSRISIGASLDDEPLYYEWMNFFQAQGWSGVMANGVYMLTAIPLFMIAKPFNHQIINRIGVTICSVVVFLTLSKSAITSLLIILGIIFLRTPGVVIRGFIPIFFIGTIFSVLFIIFQEQILILVDSRIAGFSLGGRIEVYVPLLESIGNQPFGYGLGQFYVHSTYANTIDWSYFQNIGYTETEARLVYSNAHSNWLNWLFEYGILGTQVFVLFYAWLLVKLFLTPTREALAVFASILAILLASFVHTVLGHFFVFFFTIISISFLYQRTNFEKNQN